MMCPAHHRWRGLERPNFLTLAGSIWWFCNSSWTSFGRGEDFYEGKCYKSAVTESHQTPCGVFMISPACTSSKGGVLAIKLPTRKITYESRTELFTAKHPFENPSSSCFYSTPKLWRDREGENEGCTLQSAVINIPGLKQSQTLCPVSEQKQLSLSKNICLMMRKPIKKTENPPSPLKKRGVTLSQRSFCPALS